MQLMSHVQICDYFLTIFRSENQRRGSLGPQLHPVQIYLQSEPTCAAGSLHLAALPREEAESTQGNNGGFCGRMQQPLVMLQSRPTRLSSLFPPSVPSEADSGGLHLRPVRP